uniref:Uncharacterized protein n=1 Tax=Macaca fascicularis TaxID=9541 RepID=Q9BE80_MACFA|nr:hypothetical protein [Macaca fascicularis]
MGRGNGHNRLSGKLSLGHPCLLSRSHGDRVGEQGPSSLPAMLCPPPIPHHTAGAVPPKRGLGMKPTRTHTEGTQAWDTMASSANSHSTGVCRDGIHITKSPEALGRWGRLSPGPDYQV